LPASPWRLGGLTVRELAGRVYDEIWQDEILDRAAGLSYYFLFSLFPALLFLVALLGMFRGSDLLGPLMGYAHRVLPPDAASVLSKTMEGVVRGARGSLLSLGALGALWAASAGMGSITSALNVAYGVKDPRPWWRQRLMAIVLTVVFALFTLSALLFLVFGERIGAAIANRFALGGAFETAWGLLSLGIAILGVLTGITLVYGLAPARRRRWHGVTPGAVFALVGWLGASLLLRLYVEFVGNYEATYGSIGGVMLLMLWLYLSGVTLLVGAEIDAEIEFANSSKGASTAPSDASPRT
jgi:membrane protein